MNNIKSKFNVGDKIEWLNSGDISKGIPPRTGIIMNVFTIYYVVKWADLGYGVYQTVDAIDYCCDLYNPVVNNDVVNMVRSESSSEDISWFFKQGGHNKKSVWGIKRT